MKLGLASTLFVIVARAGLIIGRQNWNLGKSALVGFGVLVVVLATASFVGVALRFFLALGTGDERMTDAVRRAY